MESPGPGHGHRGFLVQRNHEFGGIVIGVILPLGAALQQRVEATSCNRDIFTILKSGQCSFQIRPLTHAPLPIQKITLRRFFRFLRPQASNQPISKSTLRESVDCAMAR